MPFMLTYRVREENATDFLPIWKAKHFTIQGSDSLR